MPKKVVISIVVVAAIAAIIFVFLTQCENKIETTSTSYITASDDARDYWALIPEGFTTNDEYFPINLRFESTDTVVEVYCENLKNEFRNAYINYTNEAITKNNTDYFNIKQLTQDDYQILSWNRNKLSKIENDKNHYVKIDTIHTDSVQTMLIKSANPINDYTVYIPLFDVAANYTVPDKTFVKKEASHRSFNEETQKFYSDVFENPDNLSWGIFHPDYMKNDSLAKIEDEIDHKFEYALWYVGFTEEYIPHKIEGFLERAYSDGKIAELTLQNVPTHKSGNELFRLLNGDYDRFLDGCAKAIADFKHPVMLRIGNEMNGDWCEYSGYRMSLDTELYREMYRYIFSYFEKHGANNVVWIWNPNGKSFPDYKWNSEEMYYPGNEYVDVLGLTLYNTGTYYEGEEWTEFSELYTPLYENAVKKYDMPFMITEFSCARMGGDKEAWTRKMLSEIHTFKQIKLAVWWSNADFAPNGDISRAYYIDDSKEMKSIFKEYFNKY
ncbi:MAG: hypothetical protein IJB70_09765 [Clostridia bacterium]|nr:hypothetical protein [Clostridia bacterium]